MSDFSDDFLRRAKHLPSPLLDATGAALVMSGPVLIILKGHLLVEATLVDICSRLLANPAALEKGKVNFSTRLNLVQALIDDDEVPEPIWHALRDLNDIRNLLAHKLEPENIEARLCQFVKRLEDFECVLSLDKENGINERLRSCIIYLSGLLSQVGKPA